MKQIQQGIKNQKRQKRKNKNLKFQPKKMQKSLQNTMFINTPTLILIAANQYGSLEKQIALSPIPIIKS